MYKIFEITYNDGDWHTGDLPHSFYIAKSEEEVKANSKEYQKYLGYQRKRGGSVWISEVSGLVHDFYFENLDGFDISVTVRKKD